MNVSLTPKLAEFVKAQVKTGDYNNASEVVRTALRLLKEQERLHRAKLRRLRRAIAVGEAAYARGDYVVLDSDEAMTAFFDKIAGK